MELRSEIKEKIKTLPKEPGVYRFYDKDGIIIYIGKAKILKNRVSQYFHSPESLTVKTRSMVAKIADFDHTVVGSETDALLLENLLIKQFKPRYNIMLKDDKTYPWIVIKKEPFPRVFLTRRYIRDGSEYYGPYGSVTMAYAILELIGSLFYLRDCKLALSEAKIAAGKFKTCLSYHIGKCKAPCTGLFSPREYDDQIDKIRAILKGDTATIIKDFSEKMKDAASDLKFEEAHQLKEKIELLHTHRSRSIITNTLTKDTDVLSLVFEGNLAFGNFIRLVKGSIVQSLNLEFRMPLEEEQRSVLTMFAAEIISKFGPLNSEVIVPFLPDEGFPGTKFTVPVRGDKLDVLRLSQKNALVFKTESIKQEQILRPEEHKNRILASAMKDLNLPELPVRIECFDNSNIQGTNPVSSCVVFRDGVPSKKDYRHFNIKTVEGPDDYASMQEVVHRRYTRVLEEGGELPQLIVIDGGRGQLNSAYEVLERLSLADKIPIIGIAKRLETIIVPGDPDPLFLDKNSSTLRLLMQLRDEAHRFGITHHRNRRSKSMTVSILRTIPGIGEMTEKRLLSRYKSIKMIKAAPHEDLVALIGKKGAENLLKYL
jgi:excinuclease ABC subunit C